MKYERNKALSAAAVLALFALLLASCAAKNAPAKTVGFSPFTLPPEGFVQEEKGVRYYEDGAFLAGLQSIGGDLFYFDPVSGYMYDGHLTLGGLDYGEPEAFVKDGITLCRYGPPTEIPKEIHMRNIALNYDKTDTVSAEYDPKTRKAGAVTGYAAWYSTDYIDISDSYALAYNLSGHRYLQSITFYDGSKEYLSGRAITSTSNCVTLREVTVVPEGAKYVRCANRLDGSTMDFLDSYLIALEEKADYDEYMRRHPRENMKIVLIGDSLTEGDQGTHTAGVGQLNAYNYPYYLSKILECNVESCGHCGITVDGFLAEYAAGGADVRDADLVLVMLGTNGGIRTSAAKKSYRNLLKEIKGDLKKGAKLVIVTPPHATEIKGKVNYGYNGNVISAAEYALEYAADKGYPVIDAYRDSPVKEENEEIYQPNDGLHLCSEGYRVFAEFIAEQLKEKGLIE